MRLPDGATAWREYVKHPGAVMILAFVDDDTILLERQYRYPKHRHFIEIPAGKLEPGRAAARHREARADRGVRLRGARVVADRDDRSLRSATPTEVIELYGARDLDARGRRSSTWASTSRCFEAKMDDALDWVRQGIITDTKTTFALLWWKQWGR